MPLLDNVGSGLGTFLSTHVFGYSLKVIKNTYVIVYIKALLTSP